MSLIYNCNMFTVQAAGFAAYTLLGSNLKQKDVLEIFIIGNLKLTQDLHHKKPLQIYQWRD